MYLSAATLDALQQLVEQDNVLQARIRGADDVGQVVGILTPAASLKGIEVEASTLAAYLEAVVQAASVRTLNDAQLESVAGGVAPGDGRSSGMRAVLDILLRSA